VTKFVSTIAVVILGLVVAIGAVGPRIAAVLHALVPVIAITGVTAAILRAVWCYTRH
jgi:hypothetical protein